MVPLGRLRLGFSRVGAQRTERHSGAYVACAYRSAICIRPFHSDQLTVSPERVTHEVLGAPDRAGTWSHKDVSISVIACESLSPVIRYVLPIWVWVVGGIG